MKKNTVLLLLHLFYIIPSFAQVDDQQRAKNNLKYLIRDEVLQSQIKIDDKGVMIYAPHQLEKAELVIKWDEVSAFLRCANQLSVVTQEDILQEKNNSVDLSAVLGQKNKSIQGLKIALDPGHFAHNLKTAVLERKFMKIDKNEAGLKKDIAFYEADLAWETAYILAKRLEKRGAIVMLSRKKGKSSLGYNFNKWKKKRFKQVLVHDFKKGLLSEKKYHWYLNKAKDRDIFRYMTKKDMKHRAKVINDFQPNITINIHYNASGVRTDGRGNFSTIKNNYCMAFTGGGFMKNELNDVEARIHFLRLLLSTDLKKSIQLSAAIMKEHANKVKVPIIANKNNVPYLFRNSVYAGEQGVYCRNLAMTRLIRGPLCFGESLMQDNINEAVILNMKNYKEFGVKTSSRVKLVVDAYEAGILDYLNK